MTELFDKKYVHFMWEDELEGKEGFFSDSVENLQSCVILNHEPAFGTVRGKSNVFDFPFLREGEVAICKYRFFYYDPNYKCKRAYAEGKQIQFKNIIGNWEDIDCPKWNKGMEYRIKPEEPKSRRMTYRELAEWLAKGNGEHTTTLSDEVVTRITYYKNSVNEEVIDVCKIRRWGSDEWIEPTVDVYEQDCKKEE